MSTSASESPRPNYRVYDRTGGGVTEDIYAESLEDAIDQGREWIEDGWEPGPMAVQLDCVVREITLRIPRPDLDGTESSRIRDLLRLDCAPDGIRGQDYDAMDREQLASLAAYLASADDSVSEEDAAYDATIAEQITDALDGEDEDITDEQEEHDCSGAIPVADAPECLDGDTEGHDWRSPYSVLGGCKENPGVWGSGHGGVSCREVCAHCGIYRTVDSGATDPSNGQRCESTSYEPMDDASRQWLWRRLRASLPAEIEINGATVDLTWCDEEAGIDVTADDEEIGVAWHTVPTASLRDGTPDGPEDGHMMWIEGRKFRIGSYDYSTDQPGNEDDEDCTCTACIYLMRD